MKSLLIFAAAVAAAQGPGARVGGGGCCMAGGPQARSEAPIARNPVVEFKGVIKQVHISPGQGSPYLDVTRGSEVVKVYLGSMRYLIAENFNPKAGEDVEVKAYQSDGSMVAIQVALPAQKKTLKLRDDKGWPLWRGGPMRFGRPRASA